MGTVMKLLCSYEAHLDAAPITMCDSWEIEIVVRRPNMPLQLTNAQCIIIAFAPPSGAFAAKRQDVRWPHHMYCT